MSEPKPDYRTTAGATRQQRTGSGRFRFSALDVLKQAKGLPTPEGFVVVTKDFAEFLQGELSRLYALEDILREHAVCLAVGEELENTIPDMLMLCHIEAGRAEAVRAEAGVNHG